MKIFNKAPRHPDEDEIFNKTVDELVEESYPDHEGQHPLFKKFGVRTGGICDTWLYTKDWQDLPEIDKWKYIALCALYWKKQYAYWLDEEEFSQYLEHLKGHGFTEQYEYLTQSKEEEEQRFINKIRFKQSVQEVINDDRPMGIPSSWDE